MNKISIIIPTYNSEKYIEYSVLSIFKQKYKNYEIIVCDNKSKDKTISILKKLSKKKNFLIKIFIRKDKGVADALNYGFRKAKGDIICWLNSDDLFNHEFVFSNINKAFQNNLKKSYLVGNFLNINKFNKVIKFFYSFIPSKKMKNIFYYNQIFTGSFFFKKNVLKSFGKFNLKYKYAFEYEIIIHALKKYEGIYLNDFLSCFRILPTALSSNKLELKKEFDEILLNEKLKFSNSLLFKTISYIKQKVIFGVIFQKLNFFTKSKFLNKFNFLIS